MAPQENGGVMMEDKENWSDAVRAQQLKQHRARVAGMRGKENRAVERAEEKRVGIVFAEEMMLHKSPFGGHEERPARLASIRRALEEHGLWSDLVPVAACVATPEQLLLVHTRSYVRKMERLHALCSPSDGTRDDKIALEARDSKLEQLNLDAEDVFYNEHTTRCAKLAAGSSCKLVKSIVEGTVDNGIAIVRPPGHHAESHCSQGFCVFNNVAIAAKYATQELGLDRVLVVDWDVHHGNGTQNAFLDSDKVLYFSVHRHDFGKFYPANASAGPQTVGRGEGKGFNVNVAWNGKGMGDVEYLSAWERVLLPVARQFDPQLVIVSAGFDAACGDAMGECEITPQGYALLTRQLAQVAGGKLALVLEGGYDLKSLARSVRACVSQLGGGSFPGAKALAQELDAYEKRCKAADPKPSALKSIQATIECHQSLWHDL